MSTFQIRALYHGYGLEVGLRLVEGETAEQVLMAYLAEMLSEQYPPGVPRSWVVPERIAQSNGTSEYIAGNVTYRAVKSERKEVTV
jgi:hypothetical protein